MADETPDTAPPSPTSSDVAFPVTPMAYPSQLPAPRLGKYVPGRPAPRD